MASCNAPDVKEGPIPVYAMVNKKSISKKRSGHAQPAGGEFLIQDSLPPLRVGGPLMEVTPLPFEESEAPVDDIFKNLDDFPLEEQIDIIYASSRKFTPTIASKESDKGLERVPTASSAFDRAFRKWEDKMQKDGRIEARNSLRSWYDFEMVLGEVNPCAPPARDLQEILRSPSELSGRICREIALNLDKWYLDTVSSRWEVEQLMSDAELGAFCITSPDANGFINLYVRVDPLIHNTSLRLHKIGILYRRYKIRESPEYYFSLSSLLTHFCSKSTTLSSDLYIISPQLLAPAPLSPGDRVKLEDYPISLQEKEAIYARARDIAAGHTLWLMGSSTASVVYEKLNEKHSINFLIWECRDSGFKYLSIYFEKDVAFDCKLRASSYGFEVQACPIIFPSLAILLSYLLLFSDNAHLPCHLRYPKGGQGAPLPNPHSQNLFNKLRLEHYLTNNKDFWYYEVADESVITPLLRFRYVGSFLITVSDATNFTLSVRTSLHSILHFPVVKNSSEYRLKLGTFIDTHCSLPALIANSLQLVRVQQRSEAAVIARDPAYPFAFSFDVKRHKLVSQIAYTKDVLRTHLKETRSLWFQNCNPPALTKGLFSPRLAMQGSFIIFCNESIPFLTICFLIAGTPEVSIGECLIESTASGTVLSGGKPSCPDLIELIIYCCLNQHEALPVVLVPPLTAK